MAGEEIRWLRGTLIWVVEVKGIIGALIEVAF
jgi:hypothetical protein